MRRARLAIVLAPLALATVAGQDQIARPTFRTGANYVRVDVYPTRNGTPVTDLQRDDFEILEDKVPQTIEQFEHVVIRSAGPQDTRREPNTIAESRQATLDPRARVFVLFLDVTHVDLAASRAIRSPLIEALDRLIGPDDLIAVMTPEMSPRDITFARRTTTIEGFLTRYWWGERDRSNFADPVEDEYARCFPAIPRPNQAVASDQGIAQEMILRRREKQTLDALEDLVRFLDGVREERKAIITITNGWRLYGRNAALARPIDGQAPLGPIIGVNPATGTLGARPPDSTGRTASADCERDRFALSQLDDEQQFRMIVDQANRANASFYPVDPRGLAVFDEPLVPAAGVGAGIYANPMLSPAEDRARLTARNTSLRTLAEATDGLAVVDSNDLSRGLRRIADDMSSYYLLGYYSSGKLDGRFHAITVRAKRPGVQLRARRGYLANTAATASAAAAPTPAPIARPGAAAVASALASLAAVGREVPIRLHATAGWTPANTPRVWAVFEIGRGVQDDWAEGGQADAMLVDATGRTVATGRVQVPPRATTARIMLTVPGLAAGDYQLQLRAKGSRATAASSETTRITIGEAPRATDAALFRRGLTTGNRDVPTADRRFRRSDWLRMEIPASLSDPVTARVLDRNGNPLSIPVTAALRDDPDGSRWQTAEVSLAPLAAADYLMEVTGGASRTVIAFRVIP